MDIWDSRFLKIAKNEVSSWSKDPSRKHGAVIVSDKRIISTGYNGFPRNIADSEERYSDRPTKYKFVVHAELNCILNAAYNGISTKDSTMYVAGGLRVCHECAKSIIQAGIKKVIVFSEGDSGWEESTSLANDLFKEAGIEYIVYTGSSEL